MQQSKITQGGNNGNVSPIYKITMLIHKCKHFMKNTHAYHIKIHTLRNHP